MLKVFLIILISSISIPGNQMPEQAYQSVLENIITAGDNCGGCCNDECCSSFICSCGCCPGKILFTGLMNDINELDILKFTSGIQKSPSLVTIARELRPPQSTFC